MRKGISTVWTCTECKKIMTKEEINIARLKGHCPYCSNSIFHVLILKYRGGVNQ